MTKIILITVLIIVSRQGLLYAQWDKFNWKTDMENSRNRSRTDIRFNVAESQVNIRDYVYLKKFNKMTLELNNINDFKTLQYLDVLIEDFNKDIVFYKDSLELIGSGNVRIDYSVWQDTNRNIFPKRREIRFKKYTPDGSAYIKQNEEI